jgi:CBS domain-containing protein
MSDFDLTTPPFDLLDPEQLARLQRATDLVYFDAGARPLTEQAGSAFVYVVHKGRMQALRQTDAGEERLADYGPGDVLGAFAVIMGRARFTYEATEQTLCLAIEAGAFSAALRANPAFSAWFVEGLGAKRQLLAERGQSDLAELMLTRVADAELAPAVRVSPTTSLSEARRAMKAERVSCVLVGREHDEPGIVTRTDLLDALALELRSPDSTLEPLVRRPLIGVRHDEVLFQALVTMTEHHVERVVVFEQGQPIGTLGLAEVLSHYSSHSHLIGLQLARAESFAEVQAAASRMNEMIRTLHAQGARMSFLMELVSALNGRVLARLFELAVPARYRAQLCFVVLGSEGRREQIIRTDQDNALIVDDALDWPGLPQAMDELSRQIGACGWPPCPGGVMVSSPAWRRTASQWREQLARWAGSSEPRDQLDFAIACDARAVAGNPALLEALQPAFRAAARNDTVLHHFTRAALQFPTPLNLFGKLRDSGHGTDIKKGAIFPLVHGLRALALAHGVVERNSFRRAEAVVAAGGLSAALGRDLQQALAVCLRLRLAEQLATLRAGAVPDNCLRIAEMRRLDRELLRDALLVVDEFKALLRRRFHL